MPRTRRCTAAIPLIVFAAVASWSGARAEDRKIGWSDTAELSFVLTAGNTASSTLGFKNKLVRLWETSGFTIDAVAVRAESKAKTIAAVGTADDFRTIDGDKQVTAEIYGLKGRYDHKLSERMVWSAGAGWDRNRGAGVKNRYVGTAGVGNIWADEASLKFRTDYAVTYTKQKDYVEDPDADDAFAGLRFSWDFLKTFGEPTTFTNTFVFDDNIQETQDYRADMTSSLAVVMTKRLALKVSLQWLYDHQPAIRTVDLFDRDPEDPAAIKGSPVVVELDTLDTVFTASLVVNF